MAALFLFASLCIAQDPSPNAAEPQPSAAAKAELQRALQFLHSLPACRLLVESDGLRIDVRVAAERFAVQVSRDGRVFDQNMSDGHRMLSERWHKHGIGNAPKDFRAWLRTATSQDPLDPHRFYGLVTLQGLWGETGTDPALIDAKKVVARGVENVAGRPCNHLSVLDGDLACEVWVEQGDEPWIRRFRPRSEGRAYQDYTSGDLDLEDDTEWSREVPSDSFALKGSKGSELVADLQKELAKQREAQAAAIEADSAAEFAETGGGPAAVDQENQPVAADEKPHPSQGKPVPDVTLTLLDETTVRLADLKGKVVVLDFWATWCGPCVAGLPKVVEVTKKLADRGVVMFALDLEQTPRTVRRHLREAKLDVPAAVVGRPILEAFGVQGVPHTVVVDAAGVIRTVHIGFTPGDEKKLEKAILDALATPTPAPATETKPAGAPTRGK